MNLVKNEAFEEEESKAVRSLVKDMINEINEIIRKIDTRAHKQKRKGKNESPDAGKLKNQTIKLIKEGEDILRAINKKGNKGNRNEQERGRRDSRLSMQNNSDNDLRKILSDLRTNLRNFVKKSREKSQNMKRSERRINARKINDRSLDPDEDKERDRSKTVKKSINNSNKNENNASVINKKGSVKFDDNPGVGSIGNPTPRDLEDIKKRAIKRRMTMQPNKSNEIDFKFVVFKLEVM